MEQKNQSELKFEEDVVNYLTKIGGVKQWQYEKNIKTTDQLWQNFKEILERNNQGKLENPLSVTEFNQVKKAISDLRTPYEAGQFLYGINGVSEVQVSLDTGKLIYLTVFDQSQIGGGSTVYQVVNQIEREAIVGGKKNRRFDVTLLINGLPIIQMELKKSFHTVDESLSQMQQYIEEQQYSNIFSTVQVLVAMTPYAIKYMANTQSKSFNKAFAFSWQDEKDASPINDWKQFCDLVLSIPMAHELSTRFMILDGTKNKETLKVMRPYQVYATKRVLEKVRNYDFKYDDSKLGYVWHTTGSGKTITSFKTAWLASRLSHVDQVIFLVDRIALTSQTVDAYKAYDPSSVSSDGGVINDTISVHDLHRKLTRKSDRNIIVTSIQKLAKYVKQNRSKHHDQRILFIVDEAHRSTGNGQDDKGMLESIRDTFKTAAWVGYTGTPKFPETKDIFGSCLHTYTIKEAIADHNVLGFKVEFKETIKAPSNPTSEDIDDNIKASVYDTSPEHVKKVVKDILNGWESRSSNRQYNALMTVHVGGNKPSTPRAIEYYEAFKEAQKDVSQPLKIALSFAVDTSNSDTQTQTNKALHEAMKDYNKLFGTHFDLTNVSGYFDDLMSRLNKSCYDRQYLDLVIVVDQLLTGFDAPELNTLYVDRTLKNANLIQAYSRTNRVHNGDKPWGNIVNYRWPIQNEEEMNKAFTIYSNRDSAIEQQSLDELIKGNIEAGIIAKPYNELLIDMKSVVETLRDLTNGFMQVPPSERDQEQLHNKLRAYNAILNKLKQCPFDEKTNIGFPSNPDDFYESVNMRFEDVERLTTQIARDVKEQIAIRNKVDISSIDLDMTHVKEIQINYDYLVELISKMANAVYEKDIDLATSLKTLIMTEIAKTKSDIEHGKYKQFIDLVYTGDYKFDDYPVSNSIQVINEAMEQSLKISTTKRIHDFMYQWGLNKSIQFDEFELMIKNHRIGEDDLIHLTELIDKTRDDYKTLAQEDISQLSWIQYRKQLRIAVQKLADDIKGNE